MSCKDINKTADQVRMAILNGDFLWERSPDETIEEFDAKLEFVQKGLAIPPSENPRQRYYFYGTMLKKRVSDKPKAVHESHVGKIQAERESLSPDNLIKREGGASVHTVMQELVDSIYNKKGVIEDIRKRASQGLYAISGKNFDALLKQARSIIAQVVDQQSKIDPKEKARIFVEVGIVDPIENVGGTIDVLARFSDRSVSIYDYKTVASNKQSYEPYGQGGVLIGNLVDTVRKESYELSVGEYKRIIKDVFNAKSVRQTRAIPIHVRYKLKPQSQKQQDAVLEKEFDVIETGVDTSEFLEQVPVAHEKTKFEGLNALLERQNVLLIDLENKLEKKLSFEERERIKKRVADLKVGIQETIVRNDIQGIILGIHNLINSVNSRLHKPRMDDKGVPNLNYIESAELNDMINELSIYEDIIGYTHTYFGDLQESNPKLYAILKKEVDSLESIVKNTRVDAQFVFEGRLLEVISEREKDDTGNIIPVEELNFWQRNFSRFSEIDHPYFRAAWELIQSVQYEVRARVQDMRDEIFKTQDALFKWAGPNMSRHDAFGKLINRETGKLYSTVSEELAAQIQEAYKTKNIEFLKKVFVIKDREKFKEEFAKRLESRKASLKASYNNLQATVDTNGKVIKPAWKYDNDYNQALRGWVERYDITNYTDAWLNEHNRGYFKIKDEVVKANYSNEYKYIMSQKPLLDYYNMYVKYNEVFREILGILPYYDLPDNFIAYLRKDFIDHLSHDGFHFGAAIKELADAFHLVRQEDVYISDRDASGQLRKTIPLYFMQPFRRKDGTRDDTQRSYDLSENLLLFGKMAFNYHYMNAIEPTILGLKQMLGEPTMDRPGVQVRDSFGRKVKGLVQEFVTKAGLDTDTYKLFEDLTDFYLYGIKFKQKNLRGDVVQILLRLKSFWSKRALSFAVIPGMGALVAAKGATFFEGKKGIHFTNDQSRQAYLRAAKDLQGYRALSLFFDVYAEDPIERWADSLQANFIEKIANTRTLFFPLRNTDEHINDHTLNAMSYNFAISKEGKLVRLNKPGVNTEGLVSIAESFKLDEKTGKVTIPNLTKEAFIQFRNAVRSCSSGIIGSLSSQDAARYDTDLTLNMMMQFKTWMPGIMRERFGGLRYDEDVMALKWGRFNAVFSEFAPLTYDEQVAGSKFTRYVKDVLLPSSGKLILDLLTFGMSPALVKNRVNMKMAKVRFIEWQRKNPRNLNVTFDEFLEIKQAQIRAALVEMRTLLGFMALILFLGGKADDDPTKRRWQANWFTRTAFKTLTKAVSELTFVWNPTEFERMAGNIMPITGMLLSAKKTALNGADEIRDMLLGEHGADPANNTPLGYYGLQWFYGGNQIMRLFELYDEFEKSPYLSQVAR